MEYIYSTLKLQIEMALHWVGFLVVERIGSVSAVHTSSVE